MIIIYISNIYYNLYNLLYIYILLFIFNLINIELFDTYKYILLMTNIMVIIITILYLRIKLEIYKYDI